MISKRKKCILTIIVILVVSSISILYCLSNLNNNAVYYSRYTPHSKDKNPELIMVVSHLDKIKLPFHKNYRVNLDGNPALVLNKNYILQKNENKVELSDSKLFSDEGYIYYYSETGQYLYATNNKTWKKDYSNIRKQEAMQTVSKIIDPIIKAQPKPKINLQWLFDWKYKDRFQ
ncbi:hypothetical protein [Streptococcus uberis]|uniref:hypothetical protein n=1 Tax=Streptococcus uberis TaxID=1349 RepID=UPI00193A4E0F|nr:hypothetical protein [Streptococcus uberis]